MTYYGETCAKCGAPMRLSTRDRHDRPALPIQVCTNEQCRTAMPVAR